MIDQKPCGWKLQYDLVSGVLSAKLMSFLTGSHQSQLERFLRM